MILTGCGTSSTTSESGIVNLSITDAPIDDENVAGVYITFNAIRYEYKNSEEAWQDLYLPEPVTLNILDFRDGKVAFMGTTELQAGEIGHIRFVLDTSKCYITFKDDTQKQIELEIPSGDQTGYKSTNGFVVAAGGTTNITADFDVRKSITVTGNGTYKMKPTIRLVDNLEVGDIKGTYSVSNENNTTIIYVYEDGAYENNQTDPANNFNNAITSTEVSGGTFILPWLVAGTYDLVIVGYNNLGEFENVVGFMPDISVQNEDTTEIEITDSNLADTL